jgi:hypothetical protein
MNTINQLLESANPYKSVQDDAARLAAKWGKTGLLKDLGKTDANNMALMLESQAKQLVMETNATNAGGATFIAGQGEQWAGIALPLVRKVFGQISSKEYVSTQPMTLPSGLVFFLDFQYGTDKKPFGLGNSLYGQQNSTRFPFQTTDTKGGFYGEGRFTYTTNQFSGSATGLLSGSTLVTSATWAEVNLDSAYSASVSRNEIFKVTVSASVVPNYDLDSVRGFLAESGSIFVNANMLPAFTSLNYTTQNISFFYTASNGAIQPTSSFTVFYNKATVDNNRGDFEDGSTYSTPNAQSISAIAIPELNVRLQSQPIVAKTKKLKAVWTPEFAQDLNAYQNIDAEAELTNIMSEYIAMEIDLEMLDMLIEDAAAGTEYWSANANEFINTSGTGFDQKAAGTGGYYNTQGEWFQTLGTKMQKLSNRIHQLTLRGGANFMITSPTVSTVLESIPGYASNNNGDVTKSEYAFGVQKAGTLNSTYTIWKNPYMTENLILVGYRGAQFLEAGAVFAPYIPLIMTPLVYDPETFTPRKGLLTRYAKKMLRPEFYGKIYISGLNSL